MKARKTTAKRAPAKRKRTAKAVSPVEELTKIIRAQTEEIERLLEQMAEQDDVEAGDLLRLQMMMNMLSQLSETAGSIMSAMHDTIQSMARNIK